MKAATVLEHFYHAPFEVTYSEDIEFKHSVITLEVFQKKLTNAVNTPGTLQIVYSLNVGAGGMSLLLLVVPGRCLSEVPIIGDENRMFLFTFPKQTR